MSFNTNNIIYTKEDFNILKSLEYKQLNPSFLYYYKDINIITCSLCSLAIINNNSIKKHLKDKHPTIKLNNTIFNNLENYKIISYLDSTINIPNYTYYIKDLPLNLKGFKCFKCNFLSTSYKKIRNHLNIIENIKAKDTKKISYIRARTKLKLFILAFKLQYQIIDITRYYY